jgi:hypothetical protein
MLCMCVPPFYLFNQLTDFHEIWYERYVIGSRRDVVIFLILYNQ